MPNLNNIVVVNITRATTPITQVGFGTPLILGIHTKTAGIIASYNSQTEVLSDFDVTDPEAIMSGDMFGQAIAPQTVKIGKLVANVQQDTNIAITNVENDTTYTVTIGAVDYTFLSDADATNAEISAGLIAAIEAGNLGLTMTDNTTDFDIQSDIPGQGFSIVGDSNLTVSETTANSNQATQLATIQITDDDFYFVTTTSKAKKDNLDLAAYVQSQFKEFFALTNDESGKKIAQPHIQTIVFDAELVTGNTIDLKVGGEPITQVTWASSHSDTMDAIATNIQALSSVVTAVASVNTITVTGATSAVDIPVTNIVVAGGATQAGSVVSTTQNGLDVLQEFDDNNYDRSAIVFTEDTTNNIHAAWVGRNAPEDPGSITWKFAQLAGVSADTLTPSERTIVLGKNANLYQTFGGVDIMEEGTVSQGEFIDIIRGTDWIQARLQETIFGGLVNADKKIPYTNPGIDVIRNFVAEVLQRAVQRNILTNNPAPVITTPDIADVSTADKTARFLRDVRFTAFYAGAIHKVQIDGFISV